MPPAAWQLSLGDPIRNLQTQDDWHAFGETSSWKQNWTDPLQAQNDFEGITRSPPAAGCEAEETWREVKVGSFSCMNHPGLWKNVLEIIATAGAWKMYVEGTPNKSERSNTIEIFHVCKIGEQIIYFQGRRIETIASLGIIGLLFPEFLLFSPL